ncbi:zonadhesin-like [Discoglossus pictus]
MLYSTKVMLLVAIVLPLTLVTSQHYPEKPEPRCQGSYQQYYKCIPCEQFCNGPRNCPHKCKSGCSCAPGYVKQGPGSENCIAKNKCMKCGKLEVYDNCRADCQKMCDKEEKPCTYMCKPGCMCKEGYVRYKDRCILPSRCPKN